MVDSKIQNLTRIVVRMRHDENLQRVFRCPLRRVVVNFPALLPNTSVGIVEWY